VNIMIYYESLNPLQDSISILGIQGIRRIKKTCQYEVVNIHTDNASM